jgi:hypothetical protein
MSKSNACDVCTTTVRSRVVLWGGTNVDAGGPAMDVDSQALKLFHHCDDVFEGLGSLLVSGALADAGPSSSAQ